MEISRNIVIYFDILLYILYILSNKIVMYCVFFIEIFYIIILNSRVNEIVIFFIFLVLFLFVLYKISFNK